MPVVRLEAHETTVYICTSCEAEVKSGVAALCLGVPDDERFSGSVISAGELYYVHM